MQIGIDLGATKIEYILLDHKNKELERKRSETPKEWNSHRKMRLRQQEHYQNS